MLSNLLVQQCTKNNRISTKEHCSYLTNSKLVLDQFETKSNLIAY